MIKKILLSVIIAVLFIALGLYLFTTHDRSLANEAENLKEQDFLKYAEDYFSEEHIEGITSSYDSNAENSGGSGGISFKNIESIYECYPFNIAIELEKELMVRLHVLDEIRSLAKEDLGNFYQQNKSTMFLLFRIEDEITFNRFTEGLRKMDSIEEVEISPERKNLSNSILRLTVRSSSIYVEYIIDMVLGIKGEIFMYWREV